MVRAQLSSRSEVRKQVLLEVLAGDSYFECAKDPEASVSTHSLIPGQPRSVQHQVDIQSFRIVWRRVLRAGHKFCVTRSRISPEAWGSNSAWILREKGAWERFLEGLSVNRRLPKFGSLSFPTLLEWR